MSTSQDRFQRLLRKLFQFDSADLDFGIYRVMNAKRDVIRKFVDVDLMRAVDEQLGAGALGHQARLATELADAASAVRKNLGDGALSPDGILVEAYRDTPLGRSYAELQVEAMGAVDRVGLETVVYNHLYSFFSRYFEGGDFISKRRYSQREKYVVPYNGEEVLLHWANSDQYYVKTVDRYVRYRFRTRGFGIELYVIRSDVPRDNVRGETLYFFPVAKGITFDDSSGTVRIPFEHRGLTEAESRGSRRDIQKSLLDEGIQAVGRRLTKLNRNAYLALWSVHHTTSEGREVSELDYHVERFTARNSSDFFVHKNLRDFLTRELDFFLKNEVLNLDDLSETSAPTWDGMFQILNTIRRCAETIIDLLAQIEDFQRRLFEKRKFVVDVQYLLRPSELSEELIDEVVATDTQWDEWVALLHLDDTDPGLVSAKGKALWAARRALIDQHPTLLLDTRHFPAQFRDRAVSLFEHLDDSLDGLLVHGENFQALNVLAAKYHRRVRAVYIDPPYNTSGSEILYKNSYKHSSWLTLIDNRLQASRPLLADDAIQCSTIDDAESAYLHALLEKIFGRDNYLATVAIRSKPQGRAVPSGFSPNHEYAIFYEVSDASEVGRLPRDEVRLRRYRERDEGGIFAWANLRATGVNSWRPNRPKLFYPIFVLDDGTIEIPEMDWDANAQEWIPRGEQTGAAKVLPIDADAVERVWTLGWERARANIDDLLEARLLDGEWQIHRKYRPNQQGALPGTWWHDAKYSASESGTKILNDVLGVSEFSYPKSLFAVMDCIRACNAQDGDIVLDYFAGSGTTAHAVINLNRDDGGRRQFVMVEMADYFDTVVLPRIKKVSFAPEWRDGHPSRLCDEDEAAASPRAIKYLRLESYDDTLTGIEFAGDEAELTFDDYIVKYMLSWESRDSIGMPTVAMLSRPFDASIRVQNGGTGGITLVDIPETFAFLIGLHTEKVLVVVDDDRRYVIHRGLVENRRIVVVWRETAGWAATDYERDRAFLEQGGYLDDADEVLVNGDSLIPNATSLDGLFRRLMVP